MSPENRIMKEFLDRYRTGFQIQDWQKTGLLSSLATEQEPQVIELFEKAMPYILKDSDDRKVQFILPIIRRIYVELVTSRHANDRNKLLLYLLIDVDDVINHFNFHYKEIMPSFYGFKFIDPEAEFCMILTNDYIGKINRIIQEKYSNNNLYSSLLSIARDRKIDKIL